MCIEVAADDGMHILLDIGMPLYDAEGADYPFGTPQLGAAELLQSGVLLDIPGLYADDPEVPAFAAIVLTHSHLDHYGLAHHAHPAIPVYGSRGTLAILELGRVFFPDAALPGDLRVLPDDGPLRFGSLSVTGVSADHSAPDSRALLIEADEQKLIYSGDLRAYGRTGALHPQSPRAGLAFGRRPQCSASTRRLHTVPGGAAAGRGSLEASTATTSGSAAIT